MHPSDTSPEVPQGHPLTRTALPKWLAFLTATAAAAALVFSGTPALADQPDKDSASSASNGKSAGSKDKDEDCRGNGKGHDKDNGNGKGLGHCDDDTTPTPTPTPTDECKSNGKGHDKDYGNGKGNGHTDHGNGKGLGHCDDDTTPTPTPTPTDTGTPTPTPTPTDTGTPTPTPTPTDTGTPTPIPTPTVKPTVERELSSQLTYPSRRHLEPQIFTAYGFTPGEEVGGYVQSVRLDLPTMAADATGTVQWQFAVPANFEIGQHTATAFSIAAQDKTQSTFMVTPAASVLDTTTGSTSSGQSSTSVEGHVPAVEVVMNTTSSAPGLLPTRAAGSTISSRLTNGSSLAHTGANLNNSVLGIGFLLIAGATLTLMRSERHS